MRGAVCAAALLLVGCSSAPKVPTVTFEAEGFLKVYMAERDAVIRQTAPAFKKCAAATDASPLDLRQKCAALQLVKDEWVRRDTLVYKAIITGQTVTTLDWGRVAEIAVSLIGKAADIAL
jgi:hypothetical protein